MSNETKNPKELSKPVAWPNGCNHSAVAALRYLAEKPRPAYGTSAYNTEHLYMIAGELKRMSSQPLYSQEYVNALLARIEELEATEIKPEGMKLVYEAIGAHAYIVTCLVQGRPDLALKESRKWVDAFSQAAELINNG
ncbi:hypothetical protein I6G37_09865 [Serratia rubidaea]|nr:hypothetical protein I6G37_09865 [Serratia rubidaea]